MNEPNRDVLLKKTFTCPKCGQKGLGKIINGDRKEVLTCWSLFGEVAHSLHCRGMTKTNLGDTKYEDVTND